jgi:hypothetical protein
MSYVYLLGDENGFGYIGYSTDLTARLYWHTTNSDRCNASKLTKPFTTTILEEVEDKDNLEFVSQFYIKFYRSLYGNKLLNGRVPLRGKTEYRKSKDGSKKTQDYRKKNKNKINADSLNYYYENRKNILAHNTIKITCECGCLIRYDSKIRHKQSKKHINYVNSLEN